jgi:hypothetical protein
MSADPPFRCPTCGAGFPTRAELLAHEDDAHGDDLAPETPGRAGDEV